MSASSPGLPVARTVPVAAPPWQHDAPATWQYRRNFSFFVTDPAGEAGSVQASLQGHAYSPASTYSIAAQQASSILPVLRTKIVYEDRAEMRATFVLRDPDGRSLVSTSGLTATITAIGPLGSLDSSSVTWVANGVGDSSLTVPSGWFSAAASEVRVTVQAFYSSVLVASGEAGNVTLAATPVHTDVASAGLLAVLPNSPRFRDDVFSVPITAHTNPSAGHALSAWSLQLNWNTAALELASFSSSNLYATPTTNQNNAAGTLTVAVVGVQSGTALSDVTGTAVLLLTATFRVRSDASDDVVHSNVVTLTALEFLNQGSFRFVQNAAAQINDARGGAQANGQLTVERIMVAGQLAHIDTADIINTAALSGSAVQRSVGVVEVYTRAATAAADVSSACSCSSSDTAVLSASGCTLQLSGSEAGGSSVSVLVSNSSGALLSTLPMRVWYPTAALISLADPVLNRILGTSVFQSTEVVVLATFNVTGLTPIEDVDVTALVSVSVGDGSIAVLGADHTLKGLAVGSTTLSLSSAPSVQSTVTVTDSHVELTELQVLVVTSVSWQLAAPATVAHVPLLTSFSAVAQLEQQLDAEGDEAKVYVFATFTDGMTQQVPASQVDLTSNSSGVTVSNGTSSDAATLTVASGATTFMGTVLTAAWRVGVETVGTGAGWANLTLPPPTLVTATASVSRVAPPDDSASTAPISVATSFSITATVHYSDGATQDFSSDSRLNVSLVTASAACASLHGLAQIMVGAGAGCTSLEVLVTVPSLSSSLNATLTVPVVTLQTLVLSTTPYPSYSGSGSHTNLPLYKLDCTSYYQHATASLVAQLSDSSQTAVTSHSSFSSNDTAVASMASARLRSLSAGTITLTATFDGTSVSRSVEVSDTSKSVTAAVLKAGGSSSEYSFVAERNATVQAAVELTFSDGTKFTDAADAGTVDWLPLSALLNFSSAQPSALTIDSAGTMMLLENHHATVDVTTTAVCSGLSDALPVAANLYPALGDVDLGSSSGLQFQQSGSTLSVPVSANMVGATLLAFQVEVNFDYAVFSATGAAAADWPTLTSTLNDPVNEALFLGDDLQSTVGNGLVQLATLTLQIKESAVTALTGTIKVVTYEKNGQTHTIEDVAIDAGTGYAEVSNDRRRLRELGSAVPASMLRQRPARQLSGCDACAAQVRGDINGDCTFVCGT